MGPAQKRLVALFFRLGDRLPWATINVKKITPVMSCSLFGLGANLVELVFDKVASRAEGYA